jgi:hypothetical protein
LWSAVTSSPLSSAALIAGFTWSIPEPLLIVAAGAAGLLLRRGDAVAPDVATLARPIRAHRLARRGIHS